MKGVYKCLCNIVAYLCDEFMQQCCICSLELYILEDEKAFTSHFVISTPLELH